MHDALLCEYDSMRAAQPPPSASPHGRLLRGRLCMSPCPGWSCRHPCTHLCLASLRRSDLTGISLKIALQSAFSIDAQSSHACRSPDSRQTDGCGQSVSAAVRRAQRVSAALAAGSWRGRAGQAFIKKVVHRSKYAQYPFSVAAYAPRLAVPAPSTAVYLPLPSSVAAHTASRHKAALPTRSVGRTHTGLRLRCVRLTPSRRHHAPTRTHRHRYGDTFQGLRHV
jgi:hypothetical protein